MSLFQSIMTAVILVIGIILVLVGYLFLVNLFRALGEYFDAKTSEAEMHTITMLRPSDRMDLTHGILEMMRNDAFTMIDAMFYDLTVRRQTYQVTNAQSDSNRIATQIYEAYNERLVELQVQLLCSPEHLLGMLADAILIKISSQGLEHNDQLRSETYSA